MSSPSKGLRNVLIIAAMLACVGCDQVTKSIAREQLAGRETISLVNDTVRLTYAENAGVFLGLGKNLPEIVRIVLFTVVVGAVLTGMLIYVLRHHITDVWHLSAMTLIVAGGIGNLIDRITQGGVVTDFLNVGIGPIRTGIFNVADMCITTGLIVFIFAETLQQRAQKRRAAT